MTDLIDAAKARAVRITKAGIPGPAHRLPVRVGGTWTWKTYREGRAKFIGRLGNADGSPRAVIAWCPWCDYDGTEVAQGADFGDRLDKAISVHLDGCAGFAADLAEALTEPLAKAA